MITNDVRFKTGRDLFNKGDYFEAHESWEELWHDTRGGDRDFVQGLIQVTTALHHATNGNMRGAKILHGSGVELLRPYGPEHAGLRLDTLLDNFENALREIVNRPLDELAGRAHPDRYKFPWTPDRAFLI